jgi:hypothetical protein
VRVRAAAALGEVEEARAIEPLRAALSEPDPDLRAAAQSALDRLIELGLEPEPDLAEKAEAPDEITFLGVGQKGTSTYQEYRGPDAESARAFLGTHKVDDPDLYITVQTPEGIWGLDREKLFLVRLLPWQTDLSLAQCDRTIVKPPSPFSIRVATSDPEVDNVVATVGCGRCAHEWQDGMRYKERSVVRCPRCRAYNRVDTSRL